jgi:putative two-component system response regulator
MLATIAMTPPETQAQARDYLSQVLTYIDTSAAERELMVKQMHAYVTDLKSTLATRDAALLEARKSDYSKARFIANVGQDFIMPLTTILSLSKMIPGHADQGVAQQIAPKIIACAEHLLGLVNDLIAYTSISEDVGTAVESEVELLVLIEEVLPSFKAAAQVKGLRLELNFLRGPEECKKLRTDAGKLKRALRHVLDNAIKFTPSGAIQVTVQQRIDDEFPFSITIKDTGVGIPADQLERVRSLFEQGEIDEATKPSGLGIGLSLTDALVGALQGRLDIFSENQNGTTVVIRLPDNGAQDEIKPQRVWGRMELDRVSANLRDVTASQNDAIHALDRAQMDGLSQLALAAELKDGDTGTHIMRMGHFSEMIAGACGQSKSFCDIVRYASRMHDVGKIGIPDSILKKPGPLTHDEWLVMQSHPEIGSTLLSAIDSPLHKLAAEIALSHHEKWDGTGYPGKLQGEQIPLSGRIVALADYFDALTMNRCYRPAMSDDTAFAMVSEQRGKHFDPMVVDAFFTVKDQIVKKRDQINRGEYIDPVFS